MVTTTLMDSCATRLRVNSSKAGRRILRPLSPALMKTSGVDRLVAIMRTILHSLLPPSHYCTHKPKCYRMLRSLGWMNWRRCWIRGSSRPCIRTRMTAAYPLFLRSTATSSLSALRTHPRRAYHMDSKDRHLMPLGHCHLALAAGNPSLLECASFRRLPQTAHLPRLHP